MVAQVPWNATLSDITLDLCMGTPQPLNICKAPVSGWEISSDALGKIAGSKIPPFAFQAFFRDKFQRT